MEENTVMTNDEVKVVEELANIPEFDLNKGLKLGAIALIGTGAFVALVKLIKKYGWPKVKNAIEKAKAKREAKKGNKTVEANFEVK